MKIRSSVSAVIVPLAACMAILSCGGGDGGTGSTEDKSLVYIKIIYGDDDTIYVGATTAFLAIGQDSAFHELTGLTFTWSSSDSTVCTISAAGIVYGVASGTCNITASSGGVTSAAAALTVKPNGTAPGAFTLSLPANADYFTTTTPAFSWHASDGATSYKLEVATDSSFGTADVVDQTVSGTSYNLATALTHGVIYYWKVTAVNADGSVAASPAPFWFSSPIPVGTNPRGVAITPDGARALVVNGNISGTVTPVSLAGHTAGTPIPVGSSPAYIAVSPNGSQALVTNSNTVSVIDLSANSVAKTISSPCIATTLYDIAVTPDNARAVMGDLNGGCTQTGMDVINLATSGITFVNYVSFDGPFGVAVTPDGSSALATGGILETTLIRMNLATNALTTIPNVSSTFGVAITPDGASALVSSGEGETIKRISLETNAVTATFAYGSNQNNHNIAITPDGKKAVVVGDFDVGILSLTDNTMIATYAGGGNNVAITPDGKTALVTSNSNGGVLKVIKIP